MWEIIMWTKTEDGFLQRINKNITGKQFWQRESGLFFCGKEIANAENTQNTAQGLTDK